MCLFVMGRCEFLKIKRNGVKVEMTDITSETPQALSSVLLFINFILSHDSSHVTPLFIYSFSSCSH